MELCWEEPTYARFLNQIASFSRLILFDKRGTGLSDRVPNEQLPELEERADDLLVVMDAVGSRKASLIGFSEGGNLSAHFPQVIPTGPMLLLFLALSPSEFGVRIIPGHRLRNNGRRKRNCSCANGEISWTCSTMRRAKRMIRHLQGG